MSRALAPVTDSGRVELDVSPELPEVTADPGLLERVIANIVENALRHAPLDQTVRVSASRYADTIELRVIDRGPGIAPADRQIVFEPFQRRDDLATSAGPGVGLGLAIARGFIEAMHGSISLEDTPGGGLTVSIDIPLTMSPTSKEYPSPAAIR